MPLEVKTVKVSFGPFIETTLEPTTQEADAAWHLFIELSTRITTQPFNTESGHLRDAFSSLYSVLQTAREVLKSVGPSKSNQDMTFPSISLLLITDHIAPFLTKWHELLAEHEETRSQKESMLSHEKKWILRDACIADLQALQETSLRYTALFAEISGVKTPQTI